MLDKLLQAIKKTLKTHEKGILLRESTALNCKNNYMMFLLTSLAEKEENEYL